jgi:hypothetical protein
LIRIFKRQTLPIDKQPTAQAKSLAKITGNETPLEPPTVTALELIENPYRFKGKALLLSPASLPQLLVVN